ncbi:MAG: Uma2 family endonuclease [Desulfobacteraceae bacterium]|nr:Uma2 family endonuclease [Desulfobacteraceae bacterium]
MMDTDDHLRKSWVVWQEGMKYPDLIIELLSDTTWKTDKGEKKKIYEQIFRTSEYYIYDPFSYEFEGYRLSGGRYKTVKPDNERKIYSPVTGLWLAVRNDWLRWMSDDGYLLPSPDELPGLLELEKHRADMEKQRAERFAAKLRELGISPENI